MKEHETIHERNTRYNIEYEEIVSKNPSQREIIKCFGTIPHRLKLFESVIK